MNALAEQLVAHARALTPATWAAGAEALRHGAALLAADAAAGPAQRLPVALAQAELLARRGFAAAAADLAGGALAGLDGGRLEAEAGGGHGMQVDERLEAVAARLQSVRSAALLAAGRDAEARAAAEAALERAKARAASAPRPRPLALAGALADVAAARLAAGGAAAAGDLLLDALTLAEHPGAGRPAGPKEEEEGEGEGLQDAGRVLYLAAVYNQSRRRPEGALELHERAAAAADAAAAAFEGGTGALQNAAAARALAAAAKCGAAQALLAGEVGAGGGHGVQMNERLERAESLASEALEICEGVFGEHHPTVGGVLLVLGVLYRQTNRVTLCEGLLRPAEAMLLGAAAAGGEEGEAFRCHPATAARLYHHMAATVGKNERRATEAAQLAAEGARHLEALGLDPAERDAFFAGLDESFLDLNLLRVWRCDDD